MRKKALIANILIPLAVGGAAAWLTRGAMAHYGEVTKPVGSPPAVVFPIVWCILYVLMGIGAYRLWIQPASETRRASLNFYAISLALNFLWPVVFFCTEAYLPALLILLALLGLVIAWVVTLSRLDGTAAKLQLPYILWLLYAGYLNAGVWLLNR